MTKILNLLGEIVVAFVPPKLQPFAKAVVPFVIALVAVGLAMLGEGGWDAAATNAAVVGILSAVLVYLVPNLKRRA